MAAGRERGVTVWNVRESLLKRRIDLVDLELARLAAIEEPPTRKRRERIAELEDERQHIAASLAQLGPSPRAKMG
ncbi:MAG TPA: hypothetical protein VIC27_02545 [Ktedonobacterales bacterium]|jgi:hypothetical protein